MNIVSSIKKARAKGASDKEILSEIRRQNPEKEDFFLKAEYRGAGPSQILDEIIKQNAQEESSARINKEEERRRKFLERVEQKEMSKEGGFATPSSEALESSLSESSPEEEDIEEEDEEEIEEEHLQPPQKPTEKSKLWVRLLVALVIVSIFIFSIAFLYRALFLTSPPEVEPVEKVKEIITPRAPDSLIRIDREKDDIIRIPITSNDEYIMLLRKAIEEEERGEMVRIIIEDQREEEPRISNLKDFFQIFRVSHPQDFFDIIEEDFTLLLYTKEKESRLGFVVETNEDKDLSWGLMRPWEESIERDFQRLFSFLEIEVPTTDEELNSTTYENIIIRYRSTPPEEELLNVMRNTPIYSGAQNLIETGRTEEGEKYKKLREEGDRYSILVNNTEGWIEKDNVISTESPHEGIGFYYAIVGRKIVFSTSLESTKAIIDRL